MREGLKKKLESKFATMGYAAVKAKLDSGRVSASKVKYYDAWLAANEPKPKPKAKAKKG